MINNSTYTTKSCKCDNPKHRARLTKPVKSGKNFGKYRTLMFCDNCKAQWWKLEKGENNESVCD